MEHTADARDGIEIRTIGLPDVTAALAQGWSDFRRAPAFGLFFGAVFSAVGVVICLQLVVWGTSYWALPIMAGFPLIGPFAAVGLYDVSRRLEQGASLDWGEVLGVIARERGRQIPSMAFVTLFFFLAWVYFAHLIFALSFGLAAPVTGGPVEMLTSPPGLVMLAVGTVVGGGLALLLFAITVVSVPMLLDREVDVITAMITSVRTVVENRGPMLAWAAAVAGLSALAMIPLFLGMMVIFPVLGHASWHLYRRVIGPAA
ncbi:DUF2189 domain-containing protein [Halovulum dunhuangense]|nr:DUF2189 domain-containing protein [Halovulum dunhuangense]